MLFGRAELKGDENYVIIVDGKYEFAVEKGQFNSEAKNKTTKVADKVDLTKVVKATGTYASDGTYYTKSGAVYTKVTANVEADFNAGKYYVVSADKDLGSANVAIYTK